jgi:hypothetical protein
MSAEILTLPIGASTRCGITSPTVRRRDAIQAQNSIPPGIRESGLNPLAHYLRKGPAEGRRIANGE